MWLERDPVPLDDFEKNALAVLEDIEANAPYYNVPEDEGRLLRIMAQSINAQHVVELGTATGIS